MPVVNTCKAYMEDIEKCIDYTMGKYYDANDVIKFSCLFKSSNNGTLSRDQILKLVYTYFKTKNANNKVDHDNPDVVINIQVICNICYISYLKSFYEYRKYNLVEMGVKVTKADLNSKASANVTEEPKNENASQVDDNREDKQDDDQQDNLEEENTGEEAHESETEAENESQTNTPNC